MNIYIYKLIKKRTKIFANHMYLYTQFYSNFLFDFLHNYKSKLSTKMNTLSYLILNGKRFEVLFILFINIAKFIYYAYFKDILKLNNTLTYGVKVMQINKNKVSLPYIIIDNYKEVKSQRASITLNLHHKQLILTQQTCSWKWYKMDRTRVNLTVSYRLPAGVQCSIFAPCDSFNC